MDVSAFKNRIKDLFPDGGYRIFRAPGRVNIIGEHTDYNDGFVLPCAIDKELLLAIAPNNSREIKIISVDKDAETSFSLEDITHDNKNKWSNYIRGVAAAFAKRGYQLSGGDIVFQSDVPIGSGLSSSAALCVAATYAFHEVNDFNIPLPNIARIAQESENNFVGTNCGIMDQFISAMGKKDNALLIDCRDLSYKLMPFNGDISIVIGDTTIRRGLVTSKYNERRESCEKAVELLKNRLGDIKALRDVTGAQLAENKELLPEDIYRRAKHVISENERTLKAAECMVAGNFVDLGQLLNESHISLRDDYEVSCKELDIMVDIAQSLDGVYGSRMTGAGFGGCTISLVKPEYVDDFIVKLKSEYKEKTGLNADIFATTAFDGACEIMEGNDSC